MAQEIFKGLVWGSVAGIGILAIANQVVDVVPSQVGVEGAQHSPEIAELNSDAQPDAGLDTGTGKGADRATAAENAPELDTGAELEATLALETPTDPLTRSEPIEDTSIETVVPQDAPRGTVLLAGPSLLEKSDTEVETDAGETLEEDAIAPEQLPESETPEREELETYAPNLEAQEASDTVALEPQVIGVEEAAIAPDFSNDDALPESKDVPSALLASPGAGAQDTPSIDAIVPPIPAVSAETAPESITPQAPAEPPVVLIDDVPALWAYSAEHVGATDKPDMSIILVDTGRVDLDVSVLENIPFPVSFAVDALAPQAQERAQMYRTAGFEVLALTGVTEGDTAAAAGEAVREARDLLPMSVGFLDVPSASFQASAEIAKQIIFEAQTSGHGVVSFTNQSDVLTAAAGNVGAPVALIERDLDGQGQESAAIERGLDQASFRAGIDADVVLLGRMQSGTLTALREWAQGSRASFVDMVPVSAVLQNQMTQN